MSQTATKSDLPKQPRGLNRMVMTSARLLPYRAPLVRYLTLGVGTALTMAGLIIGGGLGVLPALGVMAVSALGINTIATFCNLGLRKSLYNGSRETAFVPSSPLFEFAERLGTKVTASRGNLIELRPDTSIHNYRTTLFHDGHAVIGINPEHITRLYNQFKNHPEGASRFAEVHAFALGHEIQHHKQPFWQDVWGQSLFMAGSFTGLVWTIGPVAPSLTQVFTGLGAVAGVLTLNFIRDRQNELDADAGAVKRLGSADAARHFFKHSSKARWSPRYPSPALRLAAAELQEAQLPVAERQSARAAFDALYHSTITDFPELVSGSRIPARSPSSVSQNIAKLA